MSDYALSCPHCKQSLVGPEELMGQTVRCPACQGTITLAAPIKSAAPVVVIPTSGAQRTPRITPKEVDSSPLVESDAKLTMREMVACYWPLPFLFILVRASGNLVTGAIIGVICVASCSINSRIQFSEMSASKKILWNLFAGLAAIGIAFLIGVLLWKRY